jgi:hypothetical protein
MELPSRRTKQPYPCRHGERDLERVARPTSYPIAVDVKPVPAVEISSEQSRPRSASRGPRPKTVPAQDELDDTRLFAGLSRPGMRVDAVCG